MAGADVSLTCDDCPDDLTDEGFDQGDYSSASPPGSDTSLTSLLGVEKYVQNGDSFERHWVPDVQNIFRTAPPDLLTKQLPDIMKAFTKFADEAPLKTDLLEIIPDVAGQAIENSQRVEALKDVIGDYLLPLVLRNLGCSDTAVDKKAQATLIQLLQRGYVTRFQAEIKICPSILALTKMENQVDVNTGAIALMSRLAPLLGKDITERILLRRLTELCSSSLFYVRKHAASQFGYYCYIIGKDAFETTLLPCYLALCQDEIWGVRKSCAEVMMFLSIVCPPDLRKTLLAAAYAKLLHDQCRWVRLTAFQTLGAFIATFADPPLTSIDINANGDLVLVNKDGNEFSNPEEASTIDLYTKIKMSGFSSPQDSDDGDSDSQRIADVEYLLGGLEFICDRDGNANNFDECNPFQSDPVLKTEAEDDVENREKDAIKHEDDLLSYNEYYYWHLSPPEVDVQDLLDVSADAAQGGLDDSAEDQVTDHLEELFAGIQLDPPTTNANETTSIEVSSDNKGDNLDLNHSSIDASANIKEEEDEDEDVDVEVVELPSIALEVKGPPQKVVPQDLLDDFLSMGSGESSFKDGLSCYCAYSMPAVLLTLGKENWPLLRGTTSVLARHTSYRIRRIIASSLHEVAVILGPEVASNDLSPLFEEFLKDLDEVRIRVLRNLFTFMQMISVEKRLLFLPKLEDFLRQDNVCNWRFLAQLAEQLTLCVQLFKPAEVVKYIGMYAQVLMWYNAAAVRQASLILVSEVVKHIAKDHNMTSSYLSMIGERFAYSKQWKLRQTFALLCAEMLKHDAMEPDEFGTVMLPHLLDLSWDPVPNVRLVVADCIVNCVAKIGYFVDPENGHVESLNNVLRRLQTDKDRDVRMFAECPTL